MKIFLITIEDLSQSPGVRKKIEGQYKAFRNYGNETYLLYNNDNYLYLKDSLSTTLKITRISNYFQVLLKFYKYSYNIIKKTDADCVYMRAPFNEYVFLKFVRKLKENGVKIIIEFPTYPYDEEFKYKSFFRKRALTIDKIFRKRLIKYVDFAVTYTDYEEIFGIPAIRIENGIDITQVQVRHPKPDPDKFILLAIANVSIWHGYDRLIEGMNIYYQNENILPVHLYIVGEGPEINNLKKLVVKYKLSEKVIFFGKKEPDEINLLYDISNIGIGSIGMHRIGLKDAATLKTREYCSNGIPFIIGYDDIDFNIEFKYVMKVTTDDKPIDILSIISFFDKIRNEEYIVGMRNYTERYLTWEAKLKPVLQKLHLIEK